MNLAIPNSRISSVVYFGTPEVAVPQLNGLIEAGIHVPLVITKPPAKRGRGSQLTPSPVELAARAHDLDVSYDPNDALSVDADLGVVVAYGRIIKASLLDVLPMVNLHFSLLPRWRGAAPVERAIMAGDSVTGVCLMAVDYELDTGDIYNVIEEPILAGDTVDSLRGRLVDHSVDLLLSGISAGLQDPTPQEGQPLYAPMLDKGEFIIDFTESAEAIERKTRVRKCTTWSHNKRLGIISVEVIDGLNLAPGELSHDLVGTSSGSLKLLTVQPESKKAMTAEEWLRGLGADLPQTLGEADSS